MTNLILHEVKVDDSSHVVGVFGCSLPSPVPTSTLLDHSRAIAEELGVTLQLFKADRVAGPHHLLFAALHALHSFQRGVQRASSLGMEILRFAAAQRQISRALTLLGITDDTRRLAGVILNESPSVLRQAHTRFLAVTGAEDAPQTLQIRSPAKENQIRQAFDISEKELAAIAASRHASDRRAALAKLVFDRCALTAIEK